MSSSAAPIKKERLKFIDLGRSIAILLMLEGHFTGAALDATYRDTSNWLYNAWHLLHGITAPMFFTFTGLIFAYLLLGNEQLSYWNNPRVRKGFSRIKTLLFWGYFVQVNIKACILWANGKPYNFYNLFGFHVLQSIAMCLFVLLLTYGILKWIKKGKPHHYFIGMAVLMLIFSSMLKQYILVDEELVRSKIFEHPNYVPKGFPVIIQNMFYGSQTAFGFIHTSIFTLVGAAIGSVIKLHAHKVKEMRFILSFLFTGLLTALLSIPVFIGADRLMFSAGIIEHPLFELNIPPIVRLGQVIAVISILMMIENYTSLKEGLFLKVGQHTLPIYVVHIIVLYGGISGFGLKPDIFNRDLSPYIAVLISLSAIILSFVMVKYIDPLERAYNGIFLFWKEKKDNTTFTVKNKDGRDS